jgi:hypothetical protein
MISQSTLETLTMLRRQYRPAPVPAPAKRPTGGRPNPIALHQPAPRRYRDRSKRSAELPTRAQAERTLAARFVYRIETGHIPLDVPLSSAELLAAYGAETKRAWENLAHELAAHAADYRIRITGRGRSIRYTVTGA